MEVLLIGFILGVLVAMIVKLSFLWVSWFFICSFLGLIASLLGVIKGIGWFYS